MTRRYFGTDGIRGLANKHPMTSEVALKVGMAAGKLFQNGTHRHRVVIGKDTRLSGYMLEAALMSGFTSVATFRCFSPGISASASGCAGITPPLTSRIRCPTSRRI